MNRASLQEHFRIWNKEECTMPTSHTATIVRVPTVRSYLNHKARQAHSSVDEEPVRSTGTTAG